MKTAVVAGNLLNLRSGEWGRVSILYCMSLVTLTCLNWTDVIVQGAFLQLVGVQYLPWVIICSATCSVVALFIYAAFADRVSNTNLLIAILAISGAGILLGLVMLAAGLIGPAYLLLFIVLQVPLLDVYNVHWATYVNGFYDIRAAKRIVPVLSTSARFAGIIGGLSMPLMNRLLSPAAIIGISIVALAIMAVLAILMPRLLHESRIKPARRSGSSVLVGAAAPFPTIEPDAEVKSRIQKAFISYGASLREGYHQLARSPFLRWMALSTFSMTLLMTLFNYQSSAIFEAQLQTTVAISDFLGMLSGVANLVILPFQLFVLSRLITRLGLGNATLIYPLTSLATAVGLAAAPGLGTASLAYLDRSALRTAFRIPTDNLLYNAVPLRVKARTRALVGGLIVPIGAILGGLILLNPLMRTSWFLPAATILLGLVFFLAALMVRRNYGPALVSLLEQEDYSSLGLQAPSLEDPVVLTADPATLDHLAQKLHQSTSPERAIFIAQLIVAVGDAAAVPIVGERALAAADSQLRSSLIDVLVAADLRGDEVRNLYSRFISDSDGMVRLSAVIGLERIEGAGADRFLATAAGLLTDPEIQVRLQVLPALVAADEQAWRIKGTSELQALLNDPDPHTRAQALEIVGQAHAYGFLPEVANALSDSEDEVRLAAALAAEKLSETRLTPTELEKLVGPLMDLLHDPVERVRLASVTILDRLDSSSSDAAVLRLALLPALADPSIFIRERVVGALTLAGRSAVPQLREQLDAEDPFLRQMSAVVLARIEPRNYVALVRESSLDYNLLNIYRNLCCLHALTDFSSPAAALLKRALLEQKTALLDEIFTLLAMVHDPDAVHVIAHAFRSTQSELRASAAEAFESLTTPQMANLIAPLFEPNLSWDSVKSLARQTWDISIATPAAAIELLLSEASNAWQPKLVAAVLEEMSKASKPAIDGDISRLLGMVQTGPEPGACARATHTSFAFPVWDGAKIDEREERETRSLPLVEKLIMLQVVPYFQGMSTDQLLMLAYACKEEQFPKGAIIYEQGDRGGVFYIVINGSEAIRQEKRKGLSVQTATVGRHNHFGEAAFFDNHRCSDSAVALEETWALSLDREPVIALARQNPDLSLELINALGSRLRETSYRVAELTQTHSRELHEIYDEFA